MLETIPRAVCYDCHKPKTLCVCARVRRVDNRTTVVVVQHPRERFHPIGTARFAKLGLAKVRVEVAFDAGLREDVAPAWLPENTALLYPGPQARDLRELAPSERPEHLVVIDGTWHTARTLYRDKGWLRRLPQVRLSPTEPSRYRIRREPQRDFVSTIEAIVEALGILEPETPGLAALLGAFDEMINEQLVFIKRGSDVPRTHDKRPRAWRKTPTALVEDFHRLIVTYAESSRPHPRGPRAIVHLAAIALSTGAQFERLVVPKAGLPNSAHLTHMQLGTADFDDAVTEDVFREDWRAFLTSGPASPLVAAWNQSTLDLLASETREQASRVSLKSAYRNAHGGGSGSLEEVAVREMLAEGPHRFRGRAGLRVARAVAIAKFMNAFALRNAE